EDTYQGEHKFFVQKRLQDVYVFINEIEQDLKEGKFIPYLWSDFYFNYESSDESQWFSGFRKWNNLKSNALNQKPTFLIWTGSDNDLSILHSNLIQYKLIDIID